MTFLLKQRCDEYGTVLRSGAQHVEEPIFIFSSKNIYRNACCGENIIYFFCLSK